MTFLLLGIVVLYLVLVFLIIIWIGKSIYKNIQAKIHDHHRRHRYNNSKNDNGIEMANLSQQIKRGKTTPTTVTLIDSNFKIA